MNTKTVRVVSITERDCDRIENWAILCPPVDTCLLALSIKTETPQLLSSILTRCNSRRDSKYNLLFTYKGSLRIVVRLQLLQETKLARYLRVSGDRNNYCREISHLSAVPENLTWMSAALVLSLIHI